MIQESERGGGRHGRHRPAPLSIQQSQEQRWHSTEKLLNGFAPFSIQISASDPSPVGRLDRGVGN